MNTADSFQFEETPGELATITMRHVFVTSYQSSGSSGGDTVDRTGTDGFAALDGRDHAADSDALPVLIVIADQQDFYYQEYGGV